MRWIFLGFLLILLCQAGFIGILFGAGTFVLWLSAHKRSS